MALKSSRIRETGLKEGAVTHHGEETQHAAFLNFSGQSGFFLTKAETPWYVAAIRELIVPDFWDTLQ
jgi:hypothetical protein